MSSCLLPIFYLGVRKLIHSCALMEWNVCSGDENPLSGCSCLNWYTPDFLPQGYRSQGGTRRPHHQNHRWPASQRRTTPGSTPWTPSWSRSLWWALWGFCSEQCAPASSCTAPAPTAACHHAHPQPWKTTTLNCTTASSTRWNWTNNAAARRRERSMSFCGKTNILVVLSFPASTCVKSLPRWWRPLDNQTTQWELSVLESVVQSSVDKKDRTNERMTGVTQTASKSIYTYQLWTPPKETC